jgi:hypothetical protein
MRFTLWMRKSNLYDDGEQPRSELATLWHVGKYYFSEWKHERKFISHLNYIFFTRDKIFRRRHRAEGVLEDSLKIARRLSLLTTTTTNDDARTCTNVLLLCTLCYQLC